MQALGLLAAQAQSALWIEEACGWLVPQAACTVDLCEISNSLKAAIFLGACGWEILQAASS